MPYIMTERERSHSVCTFKKFQKIRKKKKRIGRDDPVHVYSIGQF